MVRPSAASLNSLAEVLRRAQPLHSECRSILNHLPAEDEIGLLPPSEDLAIGEVGRVTNKDGAYIPHTILKPIPRIRNRIM
jgi:hypothetical protein